jgi:hypothetical protein
MGVRGSEKRRSEERERERSEEGKTSEERRRSQRLKVWNPGIHGHVVGWEISRRRDVRFLVMASYLMRLYWAPEAPPVYSRPWNMASELKHPT